MSRRKVYPKTDLEPFDKLRSSVGETIIIWRNSHNKLSQKGLSKKANIALNTVRGIEEGSMYSIDSLFAVVQALSKKETPEAKFLDFAKRVEQMAKVKDQYYVSFGIFGQPYDQSLGPFSKEAAHQKFEAGLPSMNQEAEKHQKAIQIVVRYIDIVTRSEVVYQKGVVDEETGEVEENWTKQ